MLTPLIWIYIKPNFSKDLSQAADYQLTLKNDQYA
jgi:hypothetical protein